MKLEKKLTLITTDAKSVLGKEQQIKEERLYQETVERLTSAARTGHCCCKFFVEDVLSYERDPKLQKRLRAEGLEVDTTYYSYTKMTEYNVLWGSRKTKPIPHLVPLAGFIVSCLSLAYWLV